MFKIKRGKRIKELRCDNGTEYLNQNFYKFAKEEGIYIKPAPPYTHQLNGVAERFNRTIMDRARCFLADAEISKIYWPECIKTAAYLGNRLLTNTLPRKTPFELFFGRKPNGENLKVFGSKVFVRVPEVRRISKLYPKAVKGILVGYTETGYRILVDRKIVISRHVTFIETEPKFIKIIDNKDESDQIENREIGKEQNETITAESNDLNEATKSNEVALLERPQRIKKLPSKFDDYEVYVNAVNACVPESFEQAINCDESKMWEKAMSEEIKSLEENHTWEIINEPTNKKIIEVKWIYRIKSNGKYKARVVAKGFQQMCYENEEIYSPVARMTTLRILLVFSLLKKLEIHQMDVETAFLNGNIKSEVYIYPPEGYKIEENKVCLLRKSLYGLRESPRDWYECFHDFLLSINFKRSNYDYCLYLGSINNKQTYIILYVDDILIFGENITIINEIKENLNKRFKMKDLGKVNKYLGIEIKYYDKQISLSQQDYIESLAHKYNITDCRKTETPMEINLKLDLATKLNEKLKYRNLIGALSYIANGTRPDISYAVNFLSRFQNGYDETHFKYALRVLKYLYSTKSLKLTYDKQLDHDNIMDAYVDADWAADIIDRKSTSGLIIRFFGNVIFWKSQKQKIVSRASTHAEYYALASCVEELIPINGVLEEIGINLEKAINIYEDNSGAIALAKNGKFCKNSKHIDISYHFVHDFEKKNFINVTKISTDNQLADVLTNSLRKVKFQNFRNLMGII